MDVIINLTSFNYSVTAPRAGLRKLRGSLFAQALETEPHLTTIEISNPIVNREHLDVMATIARQEKLDVKVDWDDESYTKAAGYLNWPFLQALRGGQYTRLLEFAPYVDIYRPETYGSALPWAIMNHYDSLAQHILQVTEPSPIDAHALVLAALTHKPYIVKVLLSRVDPVTSVIPRHVLNLWNPRKEIDMNLTQIVQRDNIERFLRDEGNQAFRLACISMVPHPNLPTYAQATLSCLLADERVRTTAPLQGALEMAVRTSSTILLRFLLEKTDVNPNFEVVGPILREKLFETRRMPLIQAAFELGKISEAKLLAKCPRITVSKELREKIYYEPGYHLVSFGDS
jgi:hypothetical protein